MAWHKGSWWPLYVREWYTPRASSHVFDPYSFCLVVAGLAYAVYMSIKSYNDWLDDPVLTTLKDTASHIADISYI